MCEEIRIYVACLAAYNSGRLHGVWIDATEELDGIWEQINAMLKASPEEDAEEWAIHDYEGFGGYGLSEYEGIEKVHEVACFIEEYDKLGAELMAYFNDLDDARQAMEEQYSGCYESLEDFAMQRTEDLINIPENLAFYIDYERMGRDMELSGDIFTIQTAHDEVHILWSR